MLAEAPAGWTQVGGAPPTDSEQPVAPAHATSKNTPGVARTRASLCTSRARRFHRLNFPISLCVCNLRRRGAGGRGGPRPPAPPPARPPAAPPPPPSLCLRGGVRLVHACPHCSAMCFFAKLPDMSMCVHFASPGCGGVQLCSWWRVRRRLPLPPCPHCSLQAPVATRPASPLTLC
jgi:hypothetical protein